MSIEFQWEDPGLSILALPKIGRTMVCLALATRAAVLNIVRFSQGPGAMVPLIVMLFPSSLLPANITVGLIAVTCSFTPLRQFEFNVELPAKCAADPCLTTTVKVRGGTSECFEKKVRSKFLSRPSHDCLRLKILALSL